MFSIGVGSGAKMAELNAMATDPDSDHVFVVTDFSSLSGIKGSLQAKVRLLVMCHLTTSTARILDWQNVTVSNESDNAQDVWHHRYITRRNNRQQHVLGLSLY